jgi:hypothetical protein
MIESTVYSFRARTSSKVYAKIGRAFLFEFISLCVSSIDFRVAFIQRRGPLDMLISVSQVLIIPDIVIIVSFDICGVLLGLLDLSSGWAGHEFARLHVLEQFEDLIFLLLFFFLLFDSLFMFPLFSILLIFFSFNVINYFMNFILLLLIELRIHCLQVLPLKFFNLLLLSLILLLVLIFYLLFLDFLFRQLRLFDLLSLYR